MNLENFNSFLDYQSVDTGNVLVYYDFENYSGDVLENQINSGMFGSCVDPTKYPGLVSCISTGDFFSSSGSGYFDGSATLQVGTGIDLSEFTIFVNFSYGRHSTGVPNVILSTIGSGFSGSGFYLYVNDSNRLTVEYAKNNLPYSATLNSELGNKNIVSIAKTKNNSTLDIVYHDILESNDTVLTVAPNSFVSSNLLTFGGTSFNSSNVTGISGHVDNIAILNSYLPVSKRNKIAKSFVSTGLQFNEFNITSETFNQISSLSIQNQVTGTGITGYAQNGVTNAQLKCGSSSDLCNLSGVSGDLYGDIISVVYGAEEISVSQSTLKTTTILYNNDYLNVFGYNSLLFEETFDFDSNDIYEIYSQSSVDLNINKTPVYIPATDTYRLDLDYIGQNVNFYLNGLAQQSGERVGSDVVYDYSVVDVDIDSDSFFDNLENVLYDKISGEAFVSGFNTEDESSIIMEFPGKNLSQMDLFFNGQKLISGLDYQEHPIFGTDSVEIFLSGHGTGYVYFFPRKSDITRYTGVPTTTKTFASKVLSPQVWVNGVRQKRGVNFDLYRQDSLVLNENQFDIFTTTIYNNTENYFNL